jgi:hypothetical protein
MPKGVTSKKPCSRCGRDVSLFALSRHEKTCLGPKIKREARSDGKKPWLSHPAWNKGLTAKDDHRIADIAMTRKSRKYPASGCCTAEWIYGPKGRALRATLGGYRARAGRGIKSKAIDSFGCEVTLQSSYEARCAKILNELSIRWIRPKPLRYGKRLYFPDFYLIDLNIYLDPKNSYKAKLDEQKIKDVIEQNDVKIIVLGNNQITLENFKALFPK